MPRPSLLLLRWWISVRERSEGIWKHIWTGRILLLAAAACAVFWYFHIPPPGYAVVAMTVAAGIMAIRAEISTHQKWLWLICLLVLAFIEIRAINYDRAQHDKAQAERDQKQQDALKEERQHFGDIGSGIQQSMRQSQAQFATTMTGLNENLKTAIGGDSYCYLIFANRSPDGSTILLIAEQRGRYPLRDVNARMVDQELAKTLITKYGVSESALAPSETNIQLGNIAVGHAETVGWRDLKGRDRFDFLVEFSALNGSWDELIRLRKVNGQWHQALKVWRYVIVQKDKPAQEMILYSPPPESGYPLKNGKVDWRGSGD